MTELLGVPVSILMVVVVALDAIALGLLAVLALRNRVFFRLGVRSVGRRRGRSALIVAGLMLATSIIAAALSTGDTMSSSIRNAYIGALGQTDELVTAKGSDPLGTAGTESVIGYFSSDRAAPIVDALRSSPLVDGAAAALVEPTSVRLSRTGQFEPRLVVFSADPARMQGFGTISVVGGGQATLAQLGRGEIYLDRKAADKLEARAGDTVQVYAAGRVVPFRVRSVVEYDGAGTTEGALLMPLASGQQLTGHPGQVNMILVSNRGGAVSGASHTDAVERVLRPMARSAGLDVKPVKREALDTAQQLGASFMSLFTTFGSFSIFAGILLIFLIFVMLASERRAEMGIARAVGTQRGHLVQMFVYEGAAYDLLASLVGAAVGVVTSLVMVWLIASAFALPGVEITPDVRAQSIVLASGLGLLLTLVVVSLSAWRVSVLNIVTAIRDLPDPIVRRRGRRGWGMTALGIVLGAVLIPSGLSSKQAMPFHLGVSLVILSLVGILRRTGAGDRMAYTAPGLALVVWWLLPAPVTELFVPKMSEDFSIFLLSGIMVVLGSTWVIIYNADLLIGLATASVGRIAAVAPVLKLAVAYPLRNRFRTGTTLAMFTMVVFTLVVGATTSLAFNSALNDIASFGGGYDLRATTAEISPVPDMGAALARAHGLQASQFTSVSAQSTLPVKVRQQGYGGGTSDYQLRGVDAAFTSSTSYGMTTIAKGYKTPRDVWRALQDTPDLAVVDASVVASRSNFNFGGPQPDLQVRGFLRDDQGFTPVNLDVRDPRTGLTHTFTVIGVLAETAPQFMLGITVSQPAMNAAFGGVAPSIYLFKLAPGVNPATTAVKLEAAFVANGMQVDDLRAVLRDGVSASLTFTYIILGFMGLGLIVGVAAMGVISARSVVERRQQIGVLRSIGLQRRMVEATFLLESSLISLTSIVLGTGLGLMIAYNVIAQSASQPSWGNLHFSVPWATLTVVFVAVYAASLLATIVPARRGAGVRPAEALRYQ